MSELEIVALRWWRLSELVVVEKELFGAEAWSEAMFWSELAAGHYYRLARRDGVTAGYAGLAVLDDQGWINNLAVCTHARRQGVGRALLTDLLAEAQRRGVDDVALEVAVDNMPAQRLYDGFGFEGVGLRRGYYQPSNTDALVMRRTGHGD